MSSTPRPKQVLLCVSLALFFALIGNKLLVLGKHGDGLEYAALARNMAEGLGSFWNPYFSDTFGKVYHEHPPLVYWIQSWPFKIFGDGPYLEGLYGCTVALIIIACVGVFWNRVRKDFQHKPVGAWWPILLLVSLPIFGYQSQINRLLFTFTAIALAATYVVYRSLVAERKVILYALLGGVFIYLGFIAKGPVACFTFAVPAIAWLTLKTKLSRAISITLVLVVVFTGFLLTTFYIAPESIAFWKSFWNSQIMASLLNKRSAGKPYWYIIERWGSEMVVPFILTAVLMFANKVAWRKLRLNRQAKFFLLIALASSLPFVFSRRQNVRYIFQSFPFYVLSLAFIMDSIAVKSEDVLARNRKILFRFSALAMVLFIAGAGSMIFFKDTVRRRKPFYQDFYLRQIQLPERTTISICPPDIHFDDWLFADMQRFYKASLSPEMGHDYLIVDKDSACNIPDNYEKVHQQPTVRYVLYKLNKK